jgi:pimeloyl-ACP methyl ester carboxylesterase
MKLRAKGVKSVVSRVTNLIEFNPKVNHAMFCDSLEEAFLAEYDGQVVREVVGEELLKTEPEVKRIHDELKDWNWRFGKSPKPDDGNYSVYDQYILVKRYILKNDIKNPRIIGHSIGGGVAMLLALDPDIGVKKMVLLDTPAYKQDLPKLLRYANIPVFGKLGFYLLGSHYEVMEGYRYAFYDDSKIPKEMVDELASDLSSKNGKYAFLEANRELIPDDIEKLVKRYKEITTPTLIIWGYEDVVIRRSRAYKLHRDLLNSTLKFIYHCGHLPQEEKPKKTLKLLEDFL